MYRSPLPAANESLPELILTKDEHNYYPGLPVVPRVTIAMKLRHREGASTRIAPSARCIVGLCARFYVGFGEDAWPTQKADRDAVIAEQPWDKS
jgi:hypothetical protein